MAFWLVASIVRSIRKLSRWRKERVKCRKSGEKACTSKGYCVGN